MSETEALKICSRAMILIGADSVVSFTDGTNESEVASNLYESTVLSVLTEHRWSFAVGQGQGTLMAEEPSSGYAYQYMFPTPILTIDKISPSHIDYELFSGRKIHTSYNGELWVDGVFRIEEENFPGYFTEYLEHRLAAKFAFPITGDRAIARDMSQLAGGFQKQAKSADSKQRKGVGIKNFPLISVRG